MEKPNLKTKFGRMTMRNGPENNYLWEGSINISNKYFPEDIPIYIFTNEQYIPKTTIEFAEIIVANIYLYLRKSISFIKATLTNNKEKYKIKENEFALYADL